MAIPGGDRETSIHRVPLLAVNHLVKRFTKRLSPKVFFWIKRQVKSRQFRIAHGGAEFRAKMHLVKSYGLKVIAGPFAGMCYGHDVNCGAYVAKLVGSYEQELHTVIEEAITFGYKIVIDVGCAEGYYAIGCALRLPFATVYAFDTDDDSRRYCTELAKTNGVSERVRVSGLCGLDELKRLCGGSALLICDCEGCEANLLDPSLVHELKYTDILVELHEFLTPGVTQTLLERFKLTHEIRLIDTVPREPSDYPQLDDLATADRYWAIREGRPVPMQWAWMRVRRDQALSPKA